MTQPTEFHRAPDSARTGPAQDDILIEAGSYEDAGSHELVEFLEEEPEEAIAEEPHQPDNTMVSASDSTPPAGRAESTEHSEQSAQTESDSGRTNSQLGDRPVRMPPPWQRVPSSMVRDDPAAESAVSETSPADSPSDSSDAESTMDAARTIRADLGNARTVIVEPISPESDGQARATTPASGIPVSWPRNRPPRQANLQVKRLDPWSVLKVALVLAVVAYLTWMIAVGVLYGVLGGLGVWARLNGQYADLVADQTGDRLISAGRVFGVAAVLGAVNSLLFAVSLSVGAFVYNVSADLVGGIEVTLSERD